MLKKKEKSIVVQNGTKKNRLFDDKRKTNQKIAQTVIILRKKFAFVRPHPWKKKSEYNVFFLFEKKIK